MTQAKLRIFVSSVLREFRPERDAVCQALVNTGFEPIAWNNPNDAGDTPFLDYDWRLISSCDAFLGIYGDDYGGFPSGRDVSWIETEYRSALQLGKPILVFIKQSEARTQRQETFLEEIIKNHLVSYFLDAEELVTAVIAAVEKRFASLSEAETAYRRAIERDPKDAKSYLGLGDIYADRKDYAEALKWYEKSVTLSEAVGNKAGLATTLNKLGIVYADLGETPKAIEYYEQALATAREIGDRRVEANQLSNLGVAYYSLGDVHKAIEFYEQALAIAREIDDLQMAAALQEKLQESSSQQTSQAPAATPQGAPDLSGPLTNLGVAVKRTPGATWVLDSAQYQGEDQAGGNHHIYFTVLDASGKQTGGVKCVVGWVGREPDDMPTVTLSDPNTAANFPMYANLDITLKNGPYFAYIEDESKSDVVTGMGLPEHRHVNFLLTFKQALTTIPPPASPQEPASSAMPGELAFSEASRRVFGMAERIRQSDRREDIWSTHLLLALYSIDDANTTHAFLSAFGIESTELVQIQSNPREVMALFPTKFSTGITNDPNDLRLSASVRATLNTAKESVQTRQINEIQPHHLFVALLRTPDASATQWLKTILGTEVIDWAQRTLEEWDESVDFTVANVQSRAIKAGLYIAPTGVSDNAAITDLLGFTQSADALASIILREETIPPLVVGVYGPWGSGKSSLLQLVKKSLEQRAHLVGTMTRISLWQRFVNSTKSLPDKFQRRTPPPKRPNLIIVEYDAWAYADAPKLWAGLIAKIAKELDAQLGFWGRLTYMLKYRLRQLIGAVLLGLGPVAVYLIGQAVNSAAATPINPPIVGDWLAAISRSPGIANWLVTISTGIWGVYLFRFQMEPVSANIQTLTKQFDTAPVSGVVHSIQDEVKNALTTKFPQPKEGESSKREYTREDVAKSVRANNLKIVVLIDELDRCPLERVVDILEAIKLFLSEEIFIVLMALDTRVAAEAIRLHYKDVKNPDLPHEYLEKIVQLPLQVPTANSGALQKYLQQHMPTAAATMEKNKKISLKESNLQPTTPTGGTRPSGTPSSTPLLQSRRELPVVLRRLDALATRPKFSDTPTEFTQVAELSEKFLESNPRRIKRLLNTYRYVKMLANARNEPVDTDDWQKTRLAWLTFSMRWPAFIEEAIDMLDKNELSEDGGKSIFERALSKSKSANPKPTEEQIQQYLRVNDIELIKKLKESAGNFLIEIPLSLPEAQKPQS